MPPHEPERGNCRSRIALEPVGIGRIAPRLGHHLGAERGRARVHELERLADVGRRDDALLDQELLDRMHHQLVVTGAVGHLDRIVRMVVAVAVMMAVVVVSVVHRDSPYAGSSQCS
jgi:hypothetical protein